MESISLDKSNIYYSFLNPRVASEVKQNLDVFYWYNKSYLSGNEVNTTILNFLSSTAVEDLHPSVLELRLAADGLSQAEISEVVGQVTEFVSGDYSFDSSIDIVVENLRKLVYKSIADQAYIAYKDDPIKYIERLKSFEYVKSDVSIDYRPIGFEDINPEASNEEKLVGAFPLRQDAFNRCWTFGQIPTGQFAQVVGAPGNGKSLLLMDIAISACKANKRTLYIALGDLKKWNFIIRMNSLAYDVPLDQSMMGQLQSRNNVLKLFPKSMFSMNVFPSDSLTIDDLCTHIQNYINDFDVFIVDYDGNLKDTSESMYEQGEVVYKKLTKFTIKDNKNVFIGSQPKQCYWTWESLDMSSANESSKKQQQIDLMITIGKYNNEFGVPCGIIRVAKNRNGSVTSFKYVRSNSGIFVPVDDVTYASYRDAKMYEHPDTQTIMDQVELNKIAPDGKGVSSKDAKDFGDVIREAPDAK